MNGRGNGMTATRLRLRRPWAGSLSFLVAACLAQGLLGCVRGPEPWLVPRGPMGARLVVDSSMPADEVTLSVWASTLGMESSRVFTGGPFESFARRTWRPFGTCELALTRNADGRLRGLARWAGAGLEAGPVMAYAVELERGANADGFGNSFTAGLWLSPLDAWRGSPMKIDVIFEEIDRRNLDRRRVFIGASAPVGGDVETVRIDAFYATGDVSRTWGVAASWSADLMHLFLKETAAAGFRPGVEVEYDSEDGTRLGLTGSWYADEDRRGLVWRLSVSYGWMRWGNGPRFAFDWKF